MGNTRTLQHIEADTAKLVDIGMVYLGQKPDLWWSHWVVIWEEELQLEDATCRKYVRLVTFNWLDMSSHLRMGTGWGRESRHQSISDYPHEELR